MKRYVRSQDQLAVYEEGATGQVLTEQEATDIFGADLLKRVADEYVLPIVINPDEPAATIRKRREDLGISHADLARSLSEKEETVRRLEDPSTRNPIRLLLRAAISLGLDERQISFEAGARGSEQLALRLRTLRNMQSPYLTPRTVLLFGEAAWVISVQYRLSDTLFGLDTHKKREKFSPSPNYGEAGYPAWQHGHYLAGQARQLLGYTETRPIESLRDLCEGPLAIPIVQADLPEEIAGATIGAGTRRGILLNLQGPNQNAWVRRATLAHELGHLLYDPDEHLKQLQVDDYDSLESPASNQSSSPDFYVEQRANAFAAEFLCPMKGIAETHLSMEDIRSGGLRKIMERYCVSYITARYQAWNALDRPCDLDEIKVDNVNPTDDWKGREDFAVDYFPISSAPNSRRGRFAGLVALAERKDMISSYTAAEYLGCEINEFEENRDDIFDLYDFSSPNV